MKLSKTFFAVTTAAILFSGAASALSVDQCNQLGGQVNLATAECLLTAAQQEEARALGWLPGGAAETTAILGGVAGGGGTLAAGAGLLLAVVLIGDGASGTTTTTTAP
ncbi:hypothetical protein [Aliiroseovarius sp.]|uniref:hypothetical protein n=1 Tax=Aliiroseovarius sp. TaxID=1872442 RepID=UPI00260D047B|nr:hypothetical protein [Aliiroseovarius sp.]